MGITQLETARHIIIGSISAIADATPIAAGMDAPVLAMAALGERFLMARWNMAPTNTSTPQGMKLEATTSTLKEFCDRSEALLAIDQARSLYKQRFAGHDYIGP